MKELLSWLLEKEQIFTIITVIISGLISALYYSKNNSESVIFNILLPIKRIIEEPLSQKNYKELKEITKSYSSKY